ncbi:MAG: helicase [Microbacteriaceae bacterium]|nr:helicase [Microbacteriaceae bacterium]
MLAVAGGALTLGLAVVSAAGALAASSRASAAADAAALAAADALTGWVLADPCDLAAQLAKAHEVSLDACETDAASGQVRVSVSVQTIFNRVEARARAGPSVT